MPTRQDAAERSMERGCCCSQRRADKAFGRKGLKRLHSSQPLYGYFYQQRAADRELRLLAGTARLHVSPGEWRSERSDLCTDAQEAEVTHV